MKTLYLLRHAHALDAAAISMGDHERVLSQEGVREAQAVGETLRARGFFPDFVLSSSSARTLQTSRIIFGVLLKDEGQAVRSKFDRALYMASAATILDHIHAVDDVVENLLVIAHNPGISHLATLLARKNLEFKPAGSAIFTMETSSWHDFPATDMRFLGAFTPHGGQDLG